MAEPFSLLASAIGLALPAIHNLRSDVQQFKEAQQDFQRLSETLQSAESALGLLENVDEKEWILLGSTMADEARKTILSCTTECDLFQKKFTEWTKHSKDGKIHWRDKANVVKNHEQVVAMFEQLKNCKLTINSLVSTAALYSSVRHTHITEDVKVEIAKIQAQVKAAMTATDNQLIELQNKIKALNLSNDNGDEPASANVKAEKLSQFTEGTETMRAARKVLQELLGKAQEESVAQAAAGGQVYTTTNTFGDNHGGFTVGTVHGGEVSFKKHQG